MSNSEEQQHHHHHHQDGVNPSDLLLDQHHSLGETLLDTNNLTANVNVNPSAPPASNGDDNGYIVVPGEDDHQQSLNPLSETVLDTFKPVRDQLYDIGQSVENTLNKVVAEADSTGGGSAPADEQPKEKPKETPKQSNNKQSNESSSSNKLAGKSSGTTTTTGQTGTTKSSDGCTMCPYYLLGIEYLSKVQVPPKVQDLLLWKCPKFTGAVLGTSLVLLLSLAAFSLLTVIGTLMLLALSAVGAYRFYLAVMFRIKGTQDGIFDKLSAHDLSLPKEKVQEFARLLETDINLGLNKIKSIILWDNFTTSALAFVAFYVVYCVGSVFNTLTLLILALVSVFTLPKVYQVYKKPIDDVIEKTTSCVHNLVKQGMKKLPFLNKKKVQ